MVLDTSALVAIVLKEPAGDLIRTKIEAAATSGIPAPALVEAAMVLSRRIGGDPIPLLTQLLDALEIQVIPLNGEHSRLAVQAFLRFGKGRHPAALNFGDCMVYAVASLANQPLLYIGNDFAQTDLKPA
jgi:ribonuclease VapC